MCVRRFFRENRWERSVFQGEITAAGLEGLASGSVEVDRQTGGFPSCRSTEIRCDLCLTLFETPPLSLRNQADADDGQLREHEQTECQQYAFGESVRV